MVAALSPAGYSALIKGLTNGMISKYLSGVGITLVIYDWILLVHLESQTILKSRWTFAKGLYYYIRVATFLFFGLATYHLIDFRPPLSNVFCHAWAWLICSGMFTTFAASNWLFTLRLLALYKQRKVFVWFMRIFFFCTYSVTLSFLFVSIVIYIRDLGVFYNPTVNMCQSNTIIKYSAAVFYTPALYELLIFSLTAYRAHKDASLLQSSQAPLLVVLYRDGAIAFFIMLAMRSWNIWVYTSQPVSAMHTSTNLYWAVDTILSTRVYLNLVWQIRQPGAIAFATFPKGRGSGVYVFSVQNVTDMSSTLWPRKTTLHSKNQAFGKYSDRHRHYISKGADTKCRAGSTARGSSSEPFLSSFDKEL